MRMDEKVTAKRAAAIKLAKSLKPFDTKIGQEFDTVYAETLTEDMKQAAREMKKLATVIDTYVKTVSDPNKWPNEKRPLTVVIHGETERVTKLMRRYNTQIIAMCDLLYQAVYLDESQIAEEILQEDKEVDEDDE